MCNCGQDGLKVENQKVYVFDDELDWYEVEAAKFCPFCGERLRAPIKTSCESFYQQFKGIANND